jgi:hypothetical protein
MSDIYGHLFGMPFARYDPATQSWRTSLDTSLLDLEMSSLTLPKSGGMQSGQLFERPMLGPAIEESDSSFLPTPTAHAVNYRDQEVWKQKNVETMSQGLSSKTLSLENALEWKKTKTQLVAEAQTMAHTVQPSNDGEEE